LKRETKTAGDGSDSAEDGDRKPGQPRSPLSAFLRGSSRLTDRDVAPDAIIGRLPPGPVACYLLAFGVLAAAVAIRMVATPWLGNAFSYATVFIATLLATWYCGTRPAVAAAIVGYFTVEYFIRDVPFSAARPAYVASSAGLYAAVTAIVVLFVSSFRRERDKLIEAERALAQSEEQFHQLAEHIPEGFWITDTRRHTVLYVSPACARIHGVPLPSRRETLNAWRKTLYREDRGRVLRAHRRMAVDPLDVQYRIVRPDGNMRWLHMRGYHIKNAEGEAYRVVGTIEDITERRELEDRLNRQAHFDSLTGLPNRTLFFDRLGQALNLARRGLHVVGLLFVDLDHFKTVNDTLGHPMGDKLLRRVAECLKQSVRAEDTVARLGGDEFGIILPHMDKPEHASLVAEKALALLSEPFDFDGHEVRVTASIGVAISSPVAADSQTLVRNADTAMFRVKSAGRNGIASFTSAMNERALQQLDLDRRLQGALDAREFVLHFQPRKNIATGELTGCEALLRWRTPDGTLVAPLEFVPALEASGLIRPVGEWVLHDACRQIAEWRSAGIEPLPVAVNLSSKQFSQRNIASVIENALRDFDLDARLLEIELTESAAVQNDHTRATLEKLKALGLTIVIDDFGTGKAALGDLQRLPIDALKIDSSFVSGLPDNAEHASMAKAIITMAHSLGLKVVAEGVEDEAQVAFLAENGCDEMQGYLLGRPAPAYEIAAIARQHAPRRDTAGSPTVH
jgi:diguanylate cyclase (GGDEF)-like protein/PAS domain S-box-containing protein